VSAFFGKIRKFLAQQSYLEVDDQNLPLTAHLEELRYRLIVTAVTLGACFIALYPLSGQLLIILSVPMREQLYMLAPTEAFLIHLKLAFFGAIVVSLPMTLFQGWAFVAPGLYANEKKYALPFVILGTIFFGIGGLFSYKLILPFGLSFLLGYSGSLIQPVISVANYVTFVTRMILVFGAIFELPLIVLFLTKVGVINPPMMRKYRKYAIISAFGIGAILTPPDVFTQTMLAGPLIVLYEISTWVSVFVWKKAEKDKQEEELEE
jgi:sec-independent protein translocase protein TatC